MSDRTGKVRRKQTNKQTNKQTIEKDTKQQVMKRWLCSYLVRSIFRGCCIVGDATGFSTAVNAALSPKTAARETEGSVLSKPVIISFAQYLKVTR